MAASCHAVCWELQCLAQGRFDTWTGGGTDRTAKLVISGQPALPPYTFTICKHEEHTGYSIHSFHFICVFFVCAFRGGALLVNGDVSYFHGPSEFNNIRIINRLLLL